MLILQALGWLPMARFTPYSYKFVAQMWPKRGQKNVLLIRIRAYSSRTRTPDAVHDFPETPLGALRRLQALLPQSMRSGRVTDSWKAIELVRAASRESKAGDRPRAQRCLARTRSRSLLMPSSWLARFGRRGSRCHLRLTGRHPSGIGNLPNGTFKVGHDLEP